MARNLAVVVDTFQDKDPTESVAMEVVTDERTYRKEAPLQEGLYSLVGLTMATCDCPYLRFLRPMARFHLPFATSNETAVRSVSLYLLRQYFVAKRGGDPDYTLEELKAFYADIGEVNIGMAARIRSASERYTQAKVIVILDTFAQLLSDQVNHKLLSFDSLFAS